MSMCGSNHELPQALLYYTHAWAHRRYTTIFSSAHAFAALKPSGSVTAWGNYSYHYKLAHRVPVEPTDVPTDNYTNIFSSFAAFAAFKQDGSISAWGEPDWGGSGAPAGASYTPTALSFSDATRSDFALSSPPSLPPSPPCGGLYKAWALKQLLLLMKRALDRYKYEEQ